jgi:4-amino-4-deoxy-L-arabinose transferase-like glycosyltransferase
MTPKRHIAIAIALVCLSALVQAVVIHRAVVPSVDAVRFVETARAIDEQGILPVARTEHEQPLFPAWVWLVHEGVEHVAGEFPSAWALSAQLAAAVALVLTIVPVYFLSVRLFGPAAGLAGSILFCLLPEVSRLGAEGISDSTHLLFFTLAFWAVVEYFGVKPTGCNPWACVCLLSSAGVATAVAALARAEVLVLPAALVAAWTVCQFRPRWRRPWAGLAVEGGCFVLGFALVMVPYLASVESQLGTAQSEPSPGVAPPGFTTPGLATPVFESWMSFDVKEPGSSIRRRGLAGAIPQFAEELADAFHYWVGALALLGLWRLRRVETRPADVFVRLFVVLFLAAALWFTAVEGYLSARHLMVVVVAGIGCAGYGALGVGEWLGAWFHKPGATGVSPGATGVSPVLPLRHWRDASGTRAAGSGTRAAGSGTRRLGWAIVLLAAVGCLPRTLRPLHAEHLAHRQAGHWLAVRADAPGAVLDTRGWAGLYSARSAYRYEDAEQALGDPRLAYIVLLREELESGSNRSRTLRRLLQPAGRPAAIFPPPGDSQAGRQAVAIYRWHPERLAR